MTAEVTDAEAENDRQIWLVGAGVVGCAIAEAHLAAGIPFILADVESDALEAAVRRLAPNTSDRDTNTSDWDAQPIDAPAGLAAVTFRRRSAATADQRDKPLLLIESIVERLDVKRQFLRQAERWAGENAILCSNTSTLTITSLADGLERPERLCGLHFFMPVHQREAVEVIASSVTHRHTIEACSRHAVRLGKQPLQVADGSGFVVNRMLSPYLNQAMLLVTQGTDASQIERAALQFGMPLSPFELVDWIGIRTAFDGGRVYWQAFPERIDAAPLLPALVKRKRWGRSCGYGFYNYEQGKRSPELARQTQQLCEQYTRHRLTLSDADVLELLAIPMWIESACTFQDCVVTDCSQIELAMSGGLGYCSPAGWFGYFESLGLKRIQAAIDKWSSTHRAIKPPDWFAEILKQAKTPKEAIDKIKR